MAVDVPQLELYSHVAANLQRLIEHSKEIYRQAEGEATKVTPMAAGRSWLWLRRSSISPLHFGLLSPVAVSHLNPFLSLSVPLHLRAQGLRLPSPFSG